MRKLISVCIAIFLLLSLTGCNEKQKAALEVIVEQEVLSEDVYTPKSYEKYVTALEDAKAVKDDFFASENDIFNAKKKLQTAIEELCLKPNKSELSSLIDRVHSLNEKKYTTASYSKLNDTVVSCTVVLNNENSTQQEVDKAVEQMNDVFNGLIIAKRGVYRINCSLSMISNMSVGNEWVKSIEYNGKAIKDGDRITAPLNSSITITCTVTEKDSVPDIGNGSVQLSLDGEEKTVEIYVIENRGKYAGNTAVWKLHCSAELLERV